MDISNNAHYALVIATKSEPSNYSIKTSDDAFREFLDKMREREWQKKGIEKPAENVWQIHLDENMQFLAALLTSANQIYIRLHILFSDEAPNWIKVPSDEKKTNP